MRRITSSALLEKDALDRLQRQADNIGVHRAHILAAAVALCFYSLTGSEYLNFSMPVTGTRERNSIGMTSNVVPLIIKVEPQLSLAEFIQKVAASITSLRPKRRRPRLTGMRRAAFTAAAASTGKARRASRISPAAAIRCVKRQRAQRIEWEHVVPAW
ncbi:hypothetical protein ISX56_31440, partial [Serratia ureilytica]|nr:hypothetical protein [Serratia ureilytica]